ncbi:MAG: hypothetical protein Q9190_005973 [Brigantiaea leucoxantha]
MEVWSGSIAVASNSEVIQAIGPSWNVWTSNEQTERWFIDHLLAEGTPHPEALWWDQNYGQLDVGMLLKVSDTEEAPREALKEVGREVTEILIYAAKSGFPLTPSRPCTSPRSRLSDCNRDPPLTSIDDPEDVRLYALPLSSTIFASKLERSLPVGLRPLGGRVPQPAIPRTTAEEQLPYKRQRIQALFEDATQNRRTLKKWGGGGISKLMADSNGPPSPALPPANLFHGQRLKETGRTGVVNLHEHEPKRIGLTRASTTGSIRNHEFSRPSSRKGAVNNSKRSSLSRVDSVLSVDVGSPGPEELNAVERHNKVDLSRVVMAGMRMYGLKQQKKRIAEPIVGAEELMPDGNEGKDAGEEYKLVYHQTLKAATFALRGHISLTSINQNIMRDVVDHLLAIFCGDAMSNSLGAHNDLNLHRQQHPEESAFDQPSNISSTTAIALAPPHKRRSAESHEAKIYPTRIT